MGRKMDESTFQALEEIQARCQKGEGKLKAIIPEVAEKYGRAPSTLYKALDKLARKYGVTREVYLYQQQAEHTSYGRKYVLVQPIDLTVYRQRFNEACQAMDAAQVVMEETFELVLLEEEEEGEE